MVAQIRFRWVKPAPSRRSAKPDSGAAVGDLDTTPGADRQSPGGSDSSLLFQLSPAGRIGPGRDISETLEVICNPHSAPSP